MVWRPIALLTNSNPGSFSQCSGQRNPDTWLGRTFALLAVSVIVLMWTPPVVVIHQVLADIPFRLPQAHVESPLISSTPHDLKMR